MLTVAFGLASSLCYALGDYVMVKVVRQVAVLTALTWVMAAGLVVLLPIALLTEGIPNGSTEWTAVAYAVASGLCEVGGLACVFRGLVSGNLSVVAPLASLGGGIAAVVMVALGEPLPPVALVGLALRGRRLPSGVIPAGGRRCRPAGPAHPRDGRGRLGSACSAAVRGRHAPVRPRSRAGRRRARGLRSRRGRRRARPARRVRLGMEVAEVARRACRAGGSHRSARPVLHRDRPPPRAGGGRDGVRFPDRHDGGDPGPRAAEASDRRA